MSNRQIKTTIKVGNRFLTPKGIGRNNLGVYDCIAEIVANSLDWNAARLNESDVIIKLIIGEDYISIIDNGAGMDENELDYAINLAESEDKIRDRLDKKDRKGMYGMGLKVAALSLGWKFKIDTVSFRKPNKEYSFEFNARKLEDKDTDYLEEGLFITEKDRDEDSLLSDFDHGTAVTITDLEKDIQSKSYVALKDELKIRFLPDINNLIDNYNLDFQVISRKNGSTDSVKMDKVHTENLFVDEILKVDFENPSKWAKRQEYKYQGSNGDTYQLKGFLQLLKSRSVADQHYGLNLYYNGQLIERFHKGKLLSIGGRRREMTYGELHLEGCTPDPNKKNFIEDEAFNNVRKLIHDDLQVYSRLSPTTKNQKKLVRKEIEKRKGIKKKKTFTDEENDDSNENNRSEKSDDKKDSEKSSDGRLKEMPKGTVEVTQNLYIQVLKEWIHSSSYLENRRVNWDAAYVESNKFDDLWELKVYIDPDSELYKGIEKRYGNKKTRNKILDFYKIIAVCECIYDKLMEAHDFSQDYARELTDQKVYPQVLELQEFK